MSPEEACCNMRSEAVLEKGASGFPCRYPCGWHQGAGKREMTSRTNQGGGCFLMRKTQQGLCLQESGCERYEQFC